MSYVKKLKKKAQEAAKAVAQPVQTAAAAVAKPVQQAVQSAAQAVAPSVRAVAPVSPVTNISAAPITSAIANNPGVQSIVNQMSQGVGGAISGGLPGILGGAANLPGMINMGIPSWFSESAGFQPKSGKSRATYGDEIPRPELPGYEGISTLGEAGVVRPKVDLFGKGSGVGTIRDIATGDSTSSPWVKMATEKQRLGEQDALVNAITDSVRSTSLAQAGLAAKGGLRGGAAERLQTSGARNLGMNVQDVRRQGIGQRQDIALQGEGMRLDMLKQLPGAELAAANYGTGIDQFNVGNLIRDLGSRNEQNRFKYGEDMRMKGAGMTAQAMENAGKK